jgi:PAS domain S-box-containing protein
VHVPPSLTDLSGLNVKTEDFLAAMLEATGQPMWVVDLDGLIRFANPAALAALGYGSAGELFGRHSHETIHYQHPDGTPYPAAECPMLLPQTTGEVVKSDLDWFFRRDGSMFPVSYISVPLEMPDGRGAVVAFSDIQERLRAEQVLRDHDAVLATQLTSLRRVATLVAGGAASADVFAAIAREVAQLLGLPIVLILRYEPGGTATVLADWSEDPYPFQTGSRWPLDDPSLSALVQGAAAPIVVDGDVWGSIATGQMDGGPVPDHIEDRLAEFT